MKRHNAGWIAVTGMVFALAIGGASAAPAYAQDPVWTISSSSSPTNFAPGDESGDDKYILTVVDTGGGSTAGSPIEVSDTLPTGLTASAVSGEDLGNGQALACSPTPKPACSYEGFEIASGDVLRIEVTVKVSLGAPASVTNSVSVSGGGSGTSAQAEDSTTISSTEAGFGISSFVTTWSDDQAGASVNLTAGITFNQVLSAGESAPAADARDVALSLPSGFVANPLATPICTISEAEANACPTDTAVGVAFMSDSSGAGDAPEFYSSLVYNTAPTPGHFAALTLSAPISPVIFDVDLRVDGTYGLQLTTRNLVKSPISMTMTLWGAPVAYDGAGPDHVTAGGAPSFGAPGSIQPIRFLRSPTSCEASPPSTLSGDSWVAPNVFAEASSATPKFTGCNRLPFESSLSVTPDTTTANSPAGYKLDLTIPHQQGAAGLASSDLKDAAIALPAGTGISLSSANGMQTCGEAEFSLDSSAPTICPEASTIGTTEVLTPLLDTPMEGHIYLATPYTNLFHSSLVFYIEVEAPQSASIKLAGQIETNPITGRSEIFFKDLPQLPIDELNLHFSGGPRALLSTPPDCGAAVSTAELEPWSATLGITASSSFQVESGAQGMPCAATHPFSPSFATEAKATGEADTFNSLALLVSRANHDEEQELGTLAIEAPASLAQMFSGIQACEEPRASQGLCSAASEVGQVAATVGLGAHPVSLDGPIYLTGPYGGSPQGLSIVLPIDPGPFEFGTEVVRAAITVYPSTGELGLTGGPLPTTLDGIPLHLDEFLLRFDRGTFKVDRACESLAVTGTITSTEDSSVRIANNPLGASSPPCSLPTEHTLPRKATQTSATVSLLSTHIATNGRGVAKIRLACEGMATCIGKVTLTGKLGRTSGKRRSKRGILGTAHFSLRAGASATVEIELNARARSMLRLEHGYLGAVLTILTSSPKPTQTHSVSVRLTMDKVSRHSKR